MYKFIACETSTLDHFCNKRCFFSNASPCGDCGSMERSAGIGLASWREVQGSVRPPAEDGVCGERAISPVRPSRQRPRSLEGRHGRRTHSPPILNPVSRAGILSRYPWSQFMPCTGYNSLARTRSRGNNPTGQGFEVETPDGGTGWRSLNRPSIRL